MRALNHGAAVLSRARACREVLAPRLDRLHQPLRQQVGTALAQLECYEQAIEQQGVGILPVIAGLWGVLAVLGAGVAALGFVWFARTGSELQTRISQAAQSGVPDPSRFLQAGEQLLAVAKWTIGGLAAILLLGAWRRWS